MTVFDFLNVNPWIIYVAVFAILVFLVILLIAILQGREISIKDFKIGKKDQKVITDEEKNDKDRQQAIRRIENITENLEDDDYRKKAREIIDNLPRQCSYSLAIRSFIHEQLVSIRILIHGGFAGIGYPGRHFQLEWSVFDLVDGLPTLIDANNSGKLEATIKDFFTITEPNIYGIAIPEDEYQAVLRTGIYIINRLEKIYNIFQLRKENGKDLSIYTEADLS